MARYGIEGEGELMSGEMFSLRNRLSDKENDDYTVYTTAKVISDQVDIIFNMTREQFFRDLGLSDEAGFSRIQDEQKKDHTN